ncbi:hypothetical protein [Chryseoglobus sp. 28M-23]|uniref:hypothetical protein n=1 Tax=Chryseoglobus sp. 28M-23 TaxID=2772253 RepID=UPI001747C5A2|nr:hypothetical protein [Chryseoglobus sp. 28M-23]QOD93339.1 hypothetical protein IE160_10500 [Chryseoglobus sp. 28M-23]
MLRFAVVAFLDEVALEAEFASDALPLHVSLFGAASSEADPEQIVAAVEAAYASYGPFEVTGGDDEVIGAEQNEVTLLDDADELLEAHLTLVLLLRELGVRVDDPSTVAGAYQPHVPVTDEERIDRGERLELRAIAVIDLAPDGDDSRVSVLDQFPLI